MLLELELELLEPESLPVDEPPSYPVSLPVPEFAPPSETPPDPDSLPPEVVATDDPL